MWNCESDFLKFLKVFRFSIIFEEKTFRLLPIVSHEILMAVLIFDGLFILLDSNSFGTH